MKYTLRIKNKSVFRFILKKGKYSIGKYVVIHTSKTKSNSNKENYNKFNNSKNFFAVCVSKKNGNSVERNKLKRWAREVYKLEEKNLKIGYNIIILYKKYVKLEDIEFNMLHNDVINCFKNLGVYEQI